MKKQSLLVACAFALQFGCALPSDSFVLDPQAQVEQFFQLKDKVDALRASIRTTEDELGRIEPAQSSGNIRVDAKRARLNRGLKGDRNLLMQTGSQMAACQALMDDYSKDNSPFKKTIDRLLTLENAKKALEEASAVIQSQQENKLPACVERADALCRKRKDEDRDQERDSKTRTARIKRAAAFRVKAHK